MAIPRPPRSPFERDADVATFLAEILPTRTYTEAVNECRDRFGSKRTPSRSAMHKFAERLAKRGK